MVEGAYEWVFLKTGLLEWVQNASAHARADSHVAPRSFRYYVGQFGLTVAVGAILLVVGIWLLTRATGIL